MRATLLEPYRSNRMRSEREQNQTKLSSLSPFLTVYTHLFVLSHIQIIPLANDVRPHAIYKEPDPLI